MTNRKLIACLFTPHFSPQSVNFPTHINLLAPQVSLSLTISLTQRSYFFPRSSFFKSTIASTTMAETENAPATIEVNDAIFCTHFKEVCTDCNFDGREENDSFLGYDFIDREGIVCPPTTQNKDGVYQCKKHGSAGCNQCYGWKKQISRARLQAKKAGRK